MYFTTLILISFAFVSEIATQDVPQNLVNAEEVSEVSERDVNVNANDPSITLSDPIDSATKLLIDLDAHVQQFISNDVAVTEISATTQEQSTNEPQVYSAIDGQLELANRQGGQAQGESVSGLLEQLDSLQTRIQETINQLMTRRRYILSAMLRPMLNSVRRIRSNVVRIQTQLTSIQSAATQSVASLSGNNRPNAPQPSPAEQGALDNIRKRVEDIQKRIGDIISRISSSLSLPASGAEAQSAPQAGQSVRPATGTGARPSGR